MALSDDEYEIVTFMEQEYYLNGRVPTPEQISIRLNTPVAKVKSLQARKDFKEAMLARGMSPTTLGYAEPTGRVTVEQLMVINTLLDTNDNRSDRKKLSDMGISTQKYQGWLKDPSFNAYWGQRCEALFGPGLSEANRALVDNVRRGDLGSIKFLMELTGRWSSKPASEMNIEWILMKVLETIQKHVTSPDMLQAIAADLAGIQQEAVPRATFAGEPPSALALAPVTPSKNWTL